MANRYIVRTGAMRHLGEYEADDAQEYCRGQRVAVQTQRGVEAGEVLCPASERTRQFVQDLNPGRILRLLNQEDLTAIEQARAKEVREFEVGVRCIRSRQMPMELIDVEHLLGGDRVVFYFLSNPPDKRVDFRELVRDLARELHMRIEMRQIGIRDEAKLLADYGDCGKPVCCNTHMVAMPPVSMRMAKIQKATLDPSKISGRCGRLKCCLRFEQDVYEEFLKELPPVGSRVVTRKGPGRVLAQEILARKILVEFEDGRKVMIDNSEVLTRLGR